MSYYNVKEVSSRTFDDMVDVDVDINSVYGAIDDFLEMIEEIEYPQYYDEDTHVVAPLAQILDEGVINNAFLHIDKGIVSVPSVAVNGFYAFLNNARNWNLYEETMDFMYTLLYNEAWDTDPWSDLTLWSYRPYWMRSLAEASDRYCKEVEDAA